MFITFLKLPFVPVKVEAVCDLPWANQGHSKRCQPVNNTHASTWNPHVLNVWHKPTKADCSL